MTFFASIYVGCGLILKQLEEKGNGKALCNDWHWRNCGRVGTSTDIVLAMQSYFQTKKISQTFFPPCSDLPLKKRTLKPRSNFSQSYGE